MLLSKSVHAGKNKLTLRYCFMQYLQYVINAQRNLRNVRVMLFNFDQLSYSVNIILSKAIVGSSTMQQAQLLQKSKVDSFRRGR